MRIKKGRSKVIKRKEIKSGNDKNTCYWRNDHAVDLKEKKKSRGKEMYEVVLKFILKSTAIIFKKNIHILCPRMSWEGMLLH